MSTTCPILAAGSAVLATWDEWDAGDSDDDENFLSLNNRFRDEITKLRVALAAGCPLLSPAQDALCTGDTYVLSKAVERLERDGCTASLDALLDANAESNAAVQRAVASAEALSTPHPADSATSSPLSAPSSHLSPVTADDLASALRRILDSWFAAPEVERTHDLLDRYDAQQAEPSKPALSEVENAATRACVEWEQLAELNELGASCPPEWRGFARELNSLREALRKRGAL